MKSDELIFYILAFAILGYLVYTYFMEETQSKTEKTTKEKETQSKTEETTEEQPEEETRNYKLEIVAPKYFVTSTKTKILVKAENLKGATLEVPALTKDGVGYTFNRKRVTINSDSFEEYIEVEPIKVKYATYPIRGNFVVDAVKDGKILARWSMPVIVSESEEQSFSVMLYNYMDISYDARLDENGLHVTVRVHFSPGYPKNLTKVKLIWDRANRPDKVIEEKLPSPKPHSWTVKHTFECGKPGFSLVCLNPILRTGCVAIPPEYKFRIEVYGYDDKFKERRLFTEEKKVIVHPDDGRIEIRGD